MQGDLFLHGTSTSMPGIFTRSVYCCVETSLQATSLLQIYIDEKHFFLVVLGMSDEIDSLSGFGAQRGLSGGVVFLYINQHNCVNIM